MPCAPLCRGGMEMRENREAFALSAGRRPNDRLADTSAFFHTTSFNTMSPCERLFSVFGRPVVFALGTRVRPGSGGA